VTFAAGHVAEGAFDRDGRMRLSFEGVSIAEVDLARFELELTDDAS
jgi:hypothetical protein